MMDYLDGDTAYLLGMLFGRGKLLDYGSCRYVQVELEIRRTTPKLPPLDELGLPQNLYQKLRTLVDMDLALENERAVSRLRERMTELLEGNVEVIPLGQQRVVLRVGYFRHNLIWRNLKLLCGNGTDRGNFALPKDFFRQNGDILKQFLRGFADVAVTPSYADRDQAKRVRVAFPVVHRNEKFANQLKKIFRKLTVRASLLLGDPDKRGSEKEHRLRVYAEDFWPIGFSEYFPHKNELLEAFRDWNTWIRSRSQNLR